MKIDRPYPLKLELNFNEERDAPYRYEIQVGKESFGGSSPEAALRKVLITLHGRARAALARKPSRGQPH